MTTDEKLPAEVRAKMLESQTSLFFNVALFEHAQRIADMFAKSTMVPEHFRNNVGNCMIGLNYANRLQADPFMVLQSMYVVHGRPGIEGKLVEATINQSGKYSEPLQYVWLDPQDREVERYVVLNAVEKFDEHGCQAFTIDKKSGKRVDGPKITWKIVREEGWYGKQGSKWKTIPEMMFYYRCASWFANKNCPEVKLGMPTVEELRDMDMIDITPASTIPTKLDDLTEKIKGSPTPSGATLHGDEPKEPMTPEFEDLIKLHDSKYPDCTFAPASLRGLKKHITQSHPEPEKQEQQEEQPTKGRDIQAEAEMAAKKYKEHYLKECEKFEAALGEDLFREKMIDHFHISNPVAVPQDEWDQVMKTMSQEVDKVNAMGGE